MADKVTIRSVDTGVRVENKKTRWIPFDPPVTVGRIQKRVEYIAGIPDACNRITTKIAGSDKL